MVVIEDNFHSVYLGLWYREMQIVKHKIKLKSQKAPIRDAFYLQMKNVSSFD